jgi:hypothetical protein
LEGDVPDSKPPLVFADQAIRKLVTNQLGDETMVLPNDYMVMRVVFRKRGGSWEALTQGDVGHTVLLASVVKTWGKLRRKQRKVEVR